VRWAADFRDPWMTTGSKRLYPTCDASLRIERWLERKVIERADLLTFNVERLRDAYRTRYSHVNQQKFVFIPNGVSKRLDPLPKYDRFTIAYTGSLYVGRSPEPVFHALQVLMRDARLPQDRVRVVLVGQCRQTNGAPTMDLARKYGIDSVVELVDSVPHSEAIDIVRRSHLALLLAPDLPFQIPAKVYDYLAAGTRIVAIAGEGATADLIRDTGAGEAFEAGDVDRIAAYIGGEARRQNYDVFAHDERLHRFDARVLAEEFAGHLQRVTGSREPELLVAS
jgi:hypothetical protein